MSRQLDKLKKKPHIVVGTPGRIGELLDMGKLKAQHLKHIVIDEADRMLQEESLPTIRAIIKKAPHTRQLIFASATIEAESRSNIEAIAPQLVMVQAGAAQVNKNIDHYYLVCDERDKADMLRKLYHALQPERAIVFAHRNSTANFVAAKLHQQQIPVADLSGTMNKVDRKQAMDNFRNATVRVLLTSDVSARGLDIKNVTHVLNLDVPTLSKDYLHRVGRTGRAGAKGVAITLMTAEETKLAQRFEQDLGITMRRVQLRDGKMSELI